VKRYSRVIFRVAVFLSPTTIATTLGSGTTTLRRVLTGTGAFTLGSALGPFGIVEAAFFAFGTVQSACFFGVFLAAAARSLASFSLAALAFFSAVSLAFFSLSSLFLRVFAALLIFLYSFASSLAAFSASFSS
jgi:hypothetical protein